MPATVDQIPGYTYAAPGLARSPVTLEELAALRITVGFTAEHESALRLAGEVLADQTAAVVNHWRSGIIAGIPNLARHSRDPHGRPLPDYLAASNLRFRQWILDTCLRPYDQHWLDYQHEIARRHTTLMKNRTDAVASTPFVPLRDVIGFVAVMNETIKPYLTTRGHPPAQVDQMHTAWCKSIQLQLALWAKTYTDPAVAGQQW